MARTIHGNLTGAAARTHLAQLRSEREEAADRAAAARDANKKRFDELQHQLIDAMGWEAYSEWYENDDNIPQTIRWLYMDEIFDRIDTALEKAGRSSAQERPATNEPVSDTADTDQPQYITGAGR